MEKYMLNQNDTSDLQQELDFLAAPIALPSGKLDADEYSAEDMDALTENMFGSGNVSFLSMQSAQCHDQMEASHTMEVAQGDTIISNVNLANGFIPAISASSLSLQPLSEMSHSLGKENLQTMDVEKSGDVQAIIADGNLSNGTLGSISASISSVNNGTSVSGQFAMGSSFSMSDEMLMSIRNLFSNNQSGNTFIQNITHQTGDTVNYIINGDFTQITNIVNQATTNLGDVINQTTNHLGDTINNILQGGNVGNVTNIVNNLVQNTVFSINNITCGLNQILGGEGKIAVTLDANALNTVNTHVGVLVDNAIKGDVNINVVTNHLNDVVQTITGINAPLISIVNGVGANVGFNLLNGGVGTDNNTGDTDLSIHGISNVVNQLGLNNLGLNSLGQQLSHIGLDPVEGIVGDIDIDLNLPQNLINLQGGAGDLVQTLNGLTSLHPAPLNNIINTVEAEGLTGGLGIEALNQTLSQPLDLEIGSLTNHITQGLEVPFQHLVQTVNPALSHLEQANISDWVEAILQNGTEQISDGLVGHVAANLQNGLENVTSPVGNIPCDITSPCELSEDITQVIHGAADTANLVVGSILAAEEITSTEHFLTNLTENISTPVQLVTDNIGSHITTGLHGITSHAQEVPCDLTNPCDLSYDVSGVVHGAISMGTAVTEEVIPFETLAPIEIVITETIHDTLYGLQDTTSNIGEDLSAGLQNISAHASDIPCDITNPCELSNDISGVIHGTVGMVGAIVEDIVPSSAITPIESLVSETVENAATSFHDITNNVGEDLTSGLHGIVGDADNITCNLTNPCEFSNDVSNIVNDSLSLAHTLVTDIADPMTGLLNDALQSLTENMNGSVGGLDDGLAGQWTQTGLHQSGLFSDVISNSNLGDVLPDPISGVAEGLGALDIHHNNSQHAGGGLGGLFG